MSSQFAYLLERYPAFTQTFIVREVEEMRRQGVEASVISLRPSDGETEGHFSPTSTENVFYAPEPEGLVTEIKRRRAAGELPKKINQRLEAWGADPDKLRLYEALWLGPELKKRGITHVHVHFAGIAARTAFLLNELYGVSYSVTGHAQDIFCETNFPVTLGAIIRKATVTATETDFSAQKLQHTYPALAHKIHRVYNGISIPETAPAHSPIQPPLILSVGRLIEKKGFPDLIAACAMLRNRGIAFQCKIAGDGPLREALDHLILETGLTEQVKLTGSLSQTQINELLTRASVFALAAIVLPDSDSDNFPTVITEAMAHGLPVIATRVAGIPEQVTDGVTGWLTDSSDPLTFAAKLEQVITDPDAAKQMGQAGFDKAKAEFAIEMTVKNLIKIIHPRPWWRQWL